MLVATRDPMPSPGAHDGSSRPPHHPVGTRSSRFMTAMQIAGSVLAIPVGLASAYSVYRANFSVDTTCQALRANIISMLDKKLDPTTQRMLVRHDVETFEKSCRSVDPDAEAAFRTLLAIGKSAPAHGAAPVKHVEMPAHIEPKAAKVEPAHGAPRLELRAAVPAEPVKEHAREAVREPAKVMPKETAKEVAHPTGKELPKDVKAEVKEQTKPVVADIEPLQQHDPATDAQWVDAVRSALTAHSEQAAEAAPAVRGAAPHALGEAASAPPGANATAINASVALVPAAPALPPPTQVGDRDRTVAAAHPAAKPDHPVPPGSIPDEDGPGPNGWLSKVPFVGQVLAK
jgi:hypothetical protein